MKKARSRSISVRLLKKKICRIENFSVIALATTMLFVLSLTDTKPGYMIRQDWGLLVDTIGRINLEEDVSISLEDRTNQYLAMIGEEEIEAFYADGGTIIIEDMPEEINARNKKTISERGIAAFYRDSDNSIHVGNLECNLTQPSVIHEFGHYMDYSGGRLSETAEFVYIAQDEIEKIINANRFTELNFDYAYESYKETGELSEYFAESYMYYIYKPSFFNDLAPRTYAYMSEL